MNINNDYLLLGNEKYKRIPVRYRDLDKNDRCFDCGMRLDEYHSFGCDEERCPKCRLQLISCDCLDEENDESEEL